MCDATVLAATMVETSRSLWNTVLRSERIRRTPSLLGIRSSSVGLLSGLLGSNEEASHPQGETGADGLSAKAR